MSIDVSASYLARTLANLYYQYEVEQYNDHSRFAVLRDVARKLAIEREFQSALDALPGLKAFRVTSIRTETSIVKAANKAEAVRRICNVGHSNSPCAHIDYKAINAKMSDILLARKPKRSAVEPKPGKLNLQKRK